MGETYRVGAGVRSDNVQAREWYLKAAELPRTRTIRTG
ncbi:MAG: SEL1-like repeat protein [Gemmatimonadales bacterium]